MVSIFSSEPDLLIVMEMNIGGHGPNNVSAAAAAVATAPQHVDNDDKNSSHGGSSAGAAAKVAAAAAAAAATVAAASAHPPMGNPSGDMSPAELRVLLRTWCDAVEKPLRAVEELGPEKRLEFNVRPKAGNTPPALIPRVPGLVDKVIALLKISNPRSQAHDCGALTIYSSSGMLIVFAEWRIIITTPQRVHIVRHLLRFLSLLYESGYETEWASFVRKNNDSPWMAKDQQIAREFSILKTVFPTGRSYIFGAVDQDHYFYYIYDDVKRPTQDGVSDNRSGKPQPGSTIGVSSRDTAKDPAQQHKLQRTASEVALEQYGRHSIEDNVQFNLKMYGVTINGEKSTSLQRFGLGDLNLRSAEDVKSSGSFPQPGVAMDFSAYRHQYHPQQAGTEPGSASPYVSPLAGTPVHKGLNTSFPDVPDSSNANISRRENSLPRKESSTGATADEAGSEDGRNSEECSGNPTPVPMTLKNAASGSSEAVDEAGATAAAAGEGATQEETNSGKKARRQDELAVEVITQASRFVLPDQYETLRILRDVKITSGHHGSSPTAAAASGGGAPGGTVAPRFVATYETTIDTLDETKKSLTTMVHELQPERFTIIALCDPFSPAAVALKERVPIGVEPQLYPGYALVNRTMNRFAWGYQVLQFTYNKS